MCHLFLPCEPVYVEPAIALCTAARPNFPTTQLKPNGSVPGGAQRRRLGQLSVNLSGQPFKSSRLVVVFDVRVVLIRREMGGHVRDAIS